MAADAFSKMREAIKLVEMALPALQPGTDAYKSTIDALGKLNKAFPASEEVPGVQNTQLQGLQQQAQKSAMMQALMRQMQGGGGAPPPGGPPQGAPAAQPAGAM
jgi:hypothetical protein